jgi:hypothetical protein
LGNLKATAALANKQVKLALEAPKYAAKADVAGQSVAPYALTSTVTISQLNLASLPLGRPLEGSVTARIEASGEPENWRDGSASVEVSEVTVKTSGVEFRNRSPIRASVRNRELEVLSAEIAGPGSTLSIRGRMPFEESAMEGSVSYQGTLDLASLGALAGETPPFSASGNMQLSGELRGYPTKLYSTATVHLAGGSVSASALQSPVTGIDLDVALSRGAIDVQRLAANLGTGAISAQGRIVDRWSARERHRDHLRCGRCVGGEAGVGRRGGGDHI